MSQTYSFSAALWEYGGEASWVFVTLPRDHADEIADLAPDAAGFGSVKVKVSTGATEWSTSLFPSKELRSYVLPVKRAVRERESLDIGDTAFFTIEIQSI